MYEQMKNELLGAYMLLLTFVEKHFGFSNVYAKAGIKLLIGVLLFVVVAANLIVVVVNTVGGADTANFSAAEIALFALLPIFFIILVIAKMADAI